jgi:uncharacterized protein (TIGR02246 family)
MNPCSRLLISITLLLIACPAARANAGAALSSTDTTTIIKAVLNVHAKMTEAANGPDAEKMFEFILDAGPGTIIQNGVFMKSRQDALEAVKRGMQGVARVERSYDQTRVSVLAHDAALLTAEGNTTVTLDDGRIISSPFALTEVFVLRDGKWKVLHGHHSVPPRP